ncbi:hypothetical protein K402DRAFT_423913 [Aulographum hederae CBS 113979]|uniref:ER membrane protein complex subunit 4 n=1 Tax=Aulographum hederae CBS 113979 TaxID=1176131 RepID=A0A6G1GRB3_9PEZI|nr:hypothetical protein K402DRAFT_423913 [Aulographum hederae CBS 113979]
MSAKSTTSPPPPPKWVLDLASAPSKPKSSSIPDPPGFASAPKNTKGASKQAPVRKQPTTEETDTLKVKKAWEVALAPAKQLPMNAIGMYMTGNSLQIFSIFMVFTLFKNPITAILSLPSAFARFETPGTKDRLLMVKAAYVVCNLMVLALGVWKVGQMGLLPTERSDWLGWEAERVALERARPAWDL